MKILHLLIGLPRSGKSTKAKELGFPVVEPDAIRKVIHGTPWKRNVEHMVWGIAHIMVDALFEAGHNDVILDATNHTSARRSEWESENYSIKYYEIETPMSVCIERARSTNQEYLIPVIERMCQQYEPLGGKTDG